MTTQKRLDNALYISKQVDFTCRREFLCSEMGVVHTLGSAVVY